MCTDICFPNRVSYGLIDMDALKTFNHEKEKIISSKFARDIYMFDQMACSSPSIIFVLGNEKLISKELVNFLSLIDKEIGLFGEGSQKAFMHLKAATRASLQLEGDIVFSGDYLLGIEIKNIQSILDSKLCNHGVVGIVMAKSIDEFKNYISKNAQTMVDVCGNLFDSEKGKEFLLTTALTRVVQPGNALALDAIWDGHDIIKSISKTVPIPSND